MSFGKDDARIRSALDRFGINVDDWRRMQYGFGGWMQRRSAHRISNGNLLYIIESRQTIMNAESNQSNPEYGMFLLESASFMN